LAVADQFSDHAVPVIRKVITEVLWLLVAWTLENTVRA
jgi:hypothetical protein